MSTKNLAKAALLALTLTASATSVAAATQIGGFESSTLLAVAGCPGTPPPSRNNPNNNQYNNGYNQNNNGYNQNNGQTAYYQDYDQSGYYTADDSNSPYATPSRPANSNSYGTSQEMNRQGGGSYSNDSWNNNRAVSGGGSQASQMNSEQRYPNSGYRSPSQSVGGGSNSLSRNNSATNEDYSSGSVSDPYSIGTTR